jgi:hypothetical protein
LQAGRLSTARLALLFVRCCAGPLIATIRRMDEIVTTPTATAPAPAKPGKRRRVSTAVRRALDALALGRAKSITEAAEHAGITRETLSRSLGKPHVAEYVERRARAKLALGVGRAAEVKIELLDCDSQHVRNDASSFVLGVHGIKPAAEPQVVTNVNVIPGYVIMPPLRRSGQERPGLDIDGVAVEVDAET